MMAALVTAKNIINDDKTTVSFKANQVLTSNIGIGARLMHADACSPVVARPSQEARGARLG
jgi:hypothetical protein